jgi:transcriptional regulator with XRE-family HTH domain
MTPREPKPVSKRTYTGKLARRVRELRTSKGMSVSELAKAVGVTPIAVYKWEAAENQIDSDKFPALAKALGVSAADFFPEF